MKTFLIIGLAISCGASAAEPQGATAPYNEAVRIVNGKRMVELPPAIPGYPEHRPPKITQFKRPQFLIEHERGLLQCTAAMYDAESCQASDYGQVKRYRTWVVKLKGEWQGCVGMPTPTKCEFVRPKQPPELAIINLRPLPGERF